MNYSRNFPFWFYAACFVLAGLFIALDKNNVEAQREPEANVPNPLACDMMVDDLLPIIDERQLAHYVYYGYFFQGLPTHLEAPNTLSEPDNAYTHPTDQPSTWYEFLGDDMPDMMPCSLTIDVYDGDNGRGYDVIISYSDNVSGRQPAGVVCDRIDSTGAQSRGRSKSWQCHSYERP